jgi:metallo-beta-lactamase family protein
VHPRNVRSSQIHAGRTGRIQEGGAERRNRRRDRAGEQGFRPIYTEADGLDAWRQTRIVERKIWFEMAPGFRARFWNAGHILGSASVELEAEGSRVLCLGNLGSENRAFYTDPDAPRGFDRVICESGARARDDRTAAVLAGERNSCRVR